MPISVFDSAKAHLHCQTLRLLLNPVILALLLAFRLRSPCPVLSSISCKESFSLVPLYLLLPLISFSTFLLLNPLCLLASVSYGRTARRSISPSYFPNRIFKYFDNWVVKRCRLLRSFHVQCTFTEQDGPQISHKFFLSLKLGREVTQDIDLKSTRFELTTLSFGNMTWFSE